MKHILSILLCLVVSVSIIAQKKPLTLKDQLLLKTPQQVVVAPDGKHVAYSIKLPDTVTSAWIYSLYILDTGTGESNLITSTGKTPPKPSFSKDSKNILFLSASTKSTDAKEDVANQVQIWTADYAGANIHALTSDPNDITEFTVSHDGKTIAYLNDIFDAGKDAADKEKLASKKDEIVYPQKQETKVLHLLAYPSGALLASFPLDAGAEALNFHPDGKSIVYQTNYTGEYNDEQKFDVWTISLDGAKTQLTKAEGPETEPEFSPDGKYVAYRTQTVPDIEFAEIDLTIQNIATGKTTNLTEKFDRSIGSFVWRDNESILCIIEEGTAATLYSINIPSGKIQPVKTGEIVISDLSLTSDGKECYRREDGKSVSEIYVDGKKLTNFSQQLADYVTGSQEVISYKSSDGKFDIEGVLFKPENFDPNKKYPLILTVHGGPYGNFRNTLLQTYPVRQMLSLGYVVFAPNPRGSSGYSDAFSQANRYDLGGVDYNDIMTGVDYLFGKGFIDGSRMGVTGGSYGGYLTNWIISQTPRFKAAVSMYGIFSFLTDFSNSWQPVFEKMYFGYNYWEKPINEDNLFISRSPAFHVTKIKTPTLILQGEKDVYTDISNSREMYQALHTLGIPVEFVVYPREAHGIRQEPNHYINTSERMIGWFLKYLGSMPAEKLNN